MDEKDYQFKILKWDDVRAEVKKVNAELADIIDRIDPNKRYPLIKASYRFGDLIVKNGITQLPGKDGKLLPITDSNIQKKVKDQLYYSKIPLSLVCWDVFLHLYAYFTSLIQKGEPIIQALTPILHRKFRIQKSPS